MTDAPPGVSYLRSRSAGEVLGALAGDARALPLGGGTDVLPALRDGLLRPSVLVDLRALDDWQGMGEEADGSFRIGAAMTLEAIAGDARVAQRFPALAQACAAVGSPALRAMGTLGGNLCQRPRCTWFRHAYPCRKRGGGTCFAEGGPSEHHAILGGGPCHMVHPSDPAVALMALDATVEVASAEGGRAVRIDRFYVLPRERLDGETSLRPGEVVRAVVIPAHAAGGAQRYEKLMQRAAWDFALASLAVARHAGGEVRLVLGGVAPVPWRVLSSVEEDVASGGLAPEDIDVLAERALYDARPLAHNGYKVEMASALLRRGMAWLQDHAHASG